MHKLSLGTAQFGLSYGVANRTGKVSESEGRGILDLAHTAGMDTLDTAIAYGDSEQVLGKLGVTEWKVITKLPSLPENTNYASDWVEAAVKSSLQRLNLSALEGVLLHRPGQLLSTAGTELYAALRRVQQSGMVRRIGISVYDVAELDALMPHFDFDIVQAPLNILDARLPKSGWIERLADKGVALHVRSVFLQGLLLMEPLQRPAWFSQWQAIWNGWDGWLQANRITPLQACLRHAMALPGVEQVVLGIDSRDQLQQILRALEGGLPDGYDAFQTDDARLLNPALWELT